MFTKSAEYYDAIYAAVGKNYEQEAARLHSFIQTHKRTPDDTLLDIGCGTGAHLPYLRPFYTIEGLDLDAEILAVAKQNFPDLAFHQGDMVDFNLGRAFAVVTCLFSSIGYVKTLPRLQQAIQNLARHTSPGGVVVIEPWFGPRVLQPGFLHALLVDQPKLKVARISRNEIEGNVSILNFHYLIATPEAVEYKTERHELGLFTHEESLAAFMASGLTVVHDSEGLDGRGLYIGIKSA